LSRFSCCWATRRHRLLNDTSGPSRIWFMRRTMESSCGSWCSSMDRHVLAGRWRDSAATSCRRRNGASAKPSVTANDDAVLVDDDRYAPAELLDGCSDLVNRPLRNLTAVPGVGNRLLDRPPAHL
jgi:hypothetical protein